MATKIKKYTHSNNLNYSQVTEDLKSVGVERHYLTVKSWLNDPDTIKPKHIEDVSKIFSLGESNPEALSKCLNAIKEVKNMRDKQEKI